jgi:hypothetical protein
MGVRLSDNGGHCSKFRSLSIGWLIQQCWEYQFRNYHACRLKCTEPHPAVKWTWNSCLILAGVAATSQLTKIGYTCHGTFSKKAWAIHFSHRYCTESVKSLTILFILYEIMWVFRSPYTDAVVTALTANIQIWFQYCMPMQDHSIIISNHFMEVEMKFIPLVSIISIQGMQQLQLVGSHWK